MTKKHDNIKCKECQGNLRLVMGWRSVHLRCMDCSRNYSLQEYIKELDETTLSSLSALSCDRV